MGRLTRDPQVKQIATGKMVADLGIAVTEVYKDKNGEFAERTCFVDLVAWGRQAETCAEFLRKGSPVLVEGRLQFDRWETPDGQKRSKHRVKADRVQFLNGRKRESQETPPYEKTAPKAAADKLERCVVAGPGGEEKCEF